MNYKCVLFSRGVKLILCFAGNWKQSDEPSALTVLRNMDKVIKGHHLVPEHVETRSLYCPDKPGVEQVSELILYLPAF